MSRGSPPREENGRARHAREPDLCEPGCHRRRALYRRGGVGVDDFRCRAHVTTRGVEEANPTHSVVFVRRGAFGRAHRGETLLADANHVLFFNQGEGYRYTHPLPGGDECTIVTLDAATALSAVERFDPAACERPESPFRVGHALSTPAIARLHLECLSALRLGTVTLAAEDALSELVDESLQAAQAGRGPRRRERARSATRRRDLAEAVKLVLNERFESPPTLHELAAFVACSPSHLSRTFRRETGLGLRHYLRRLRARLAADRLGQRPGDLTGLALDLGFYDHSRRAPDQRVVSRHVLDLDGDLAPREGDALDRHAVEKLGQRPD